MAYTLTQPCHEQIPKPPAVRSLVRWKISSVLWIPRHSFQLGVLSTDPSRNLLCQYADAALPGLLLCASVADLCTLRGKLDEFG